MQTKPKANSVITHSVAPIPNSSGVVITFKVLGAGDVSLDTTKLHNDIVGRAIIHGLIQRVSDQAALSRDPLTGVAASPQDKLNAMVELVDHYMSGAAEWRMVGTSGGSRAGSMLLEALVEAYPAKTRDELRTWLKKQSAANRAALAAEARIKAIIDRKTGELAESVDTEELLSELE